MARRFVLILAVALVLGVVTASLVYQAITGQVSGEVKAPPMRQVAVAAANINLGETLTPQHVKLMPWPSDAVPAGTFGSVAEVDGRVALSSIVVGEPLMDAKLAAKLAGGGILPMLVPEHLRGITIKVDDAVRESGFISPNSRVDIIVTIADKQGSMDKKSKVILQNIPVLAAGQSVEMRGNKPVSVTTVTLALTPEQSERLALGQAEGRLMLATRKLGDERVVQTSGTNVQKLLEISEMPARKQTRSTQAKSSEAPPPPYTVVVFRGSQMSEHNFVQNGSHWVEQAPVKAKIR